jgi:hypothetical protein
MVVPPSRRTPISMDRTRTDAYRHAVKSLRDLQASKFTSDQMDLFTYALDSYLFADSSEAMDEADWVFAIAAAELNDITASGRLLAETTDRLKAEILAIRAQPALV